MQEKEISEVSLKNTELNSINSELQKQLDNLSKVRDFLLLSLLLWEKVCDFLLVYCCWNGYVMYYKMMKTRCRCSRVMSSV